MQSRGCSSQNASSSDRLADPGLAAEQENLPAATLLHRHQALGQRGQLVGALEQAACVGGADL